MPSFCTANNISNAQQTISPMPSIQLTAVFFMETRNNNRQICSDMSMSLERRRKWTEEYDTEKYEKYSDKRCQYI